VGVAKCRNIVPLKNDVLYIMYPTESRNSSVIFNVSSDQEILKT